jgi:hypothetical protein
MIFEEFERRAPFFHKFCSVHGDMRIQIIHSSSEDESNPFHEDTFPSESLSDPLIRFRFALQRLSQLPLTILRFTEILLQIFQISRKGRFL